MPGVGDIGAGALRIGPGEEDILGALGIPGYGGGRSVTQSQSMPTLQDLMTANRDSLMTNPLGALANIREARNAGGFAPTASGVKYIFTGGSPYKRTVFDRMAETALVVGALRAQAAERKRAAERQKAERDRKAAAMGGEG